MKTQSWWWVLLSIQLFARSSSGLPFAYHSSCEDPTSGIFRDYLKNHSFGQGSNDDETNSGLTVLLPSKDEYIPPSYMKDLQSDPILRKRIVENHVLHSPVKPGTTHSLSGLPIAIITRGEALYANGYPLRRCSEDSSVYILDGFLTSRKNPFPNFRLPSLNENQLEILKEFGSRFHEHWIAKKESLEDERSHNLIILVPKNEEVEHVPDSQVLQLLASHIIPVGPKPLGSSRFKNLMGENINISKINGSLSIHGEPLDYPRNSGSITFFKSPRSLLVRDNYISANPSFNYNAEEAQTALVPHLNDDIRRALTQMQIFRFAWIWNEIESNSQTHYANTKENLCALPKKSGSCKRNIPQFYYDGKDCVPFVYGGCEGNLNRFSTLRDCAKTCISDPVQRQEVFKEICVLPYFQPSSSSSTCDKELRVTGYNKEKGYCEPISVNSTQACSLSESLFEKHGTCRDLCEESTRNESGFPPKPSKGCSSPTANCKSTSEEKAVKWIFDESTSKCRPSKTNCMDEGFHDFETDCLKACQKDSNQVLTIFAPTDGALEVLSNGLNNNTDDSFSKKDILPFFLRESTSIERPYVYSNDKFRVVVLHRIIQRRPKPRMKKPSEYLRSSERPKSFSPFNGISELRSEYLKRNKFVRYNIVYESLYQLLNTQLFNQVHKVLTENDEEAEEASNSSKARGFCLQKASPGVFDNASPQNSTRYFYNDELGSCQSFTFLGIGGNSNNFHSYSECSDFCGKFKGTIGEVEVIGPREGMTGRAVLVQLSNKGLLYIDGTFKGLKPKTKYSFEAGLKELTTVTSSSEGTIFINQQIPSTGHGYLSSVIDNKMVIRELKDDLEQQSEIVGIGSIVKAPNFIEARTKIMHDSNDLIQGEIILTQEGPFAPVLITGFVDGIMEGLHGFHIHQNGDTSDDCRAAGSHFNPFGKTHGEPTSPHRHVGDLGNVQVYWGSNLQVHLSDGVISLYKSTNHIVNRAIVIHEKQDDFGLGGDASSLATGNAGARIACGVVTKSHVSKGDPKESKIQESTEGKIFFVPNDSIMKLFLNDQPVRNTEYLRELAFCHLAKAKFNFQTKEKKYTTECGFVVNILRRDHVNGRLEMIINGVRAEKVIRDGMNTFFVLPFLLYANDEAIQGGIDNDIPSFKKRAFAILPSAEEKSYDGVFYNREQSIKFTQVSPNSPLSISTSLEPLLSGPHGYSQAAQIRVMRNSGVYPKCPEYNNDSYVDLGTVTLNTWSRTYTLSTNNVSLYGRDSIIGGILVFYDGSTPLLCGRIKEGEHIVNDYPREENEWKDIPLLRLPPLDEKIKSTLDASDDYLLFDAWQGAIKNGMAFTSSEETEDITLVSLDDENFKRLIPRPSERESHPCNQDLFFQHKILEMMIIYGKIGREAVYDREVIMPNSIGGYPYIFNLNEEDSITIRGRKPLRSEASKSTNLYLMERSMFMSFSFLGPGDVFDSFDRSNYRVKHPDW